MGLIKHGEGRVLADPEQEDAGQPVPEAPEEEPDQPQPAPPAPESSGDEAG
jgi:hypothetical protein